jgi:hypothetical protein
LHIARKGHTVRPTVRAIVVGASLLFVLNLAAADKKPPPPIDPRGRPDERLMKQERRYYIWHDTEGWHIRSASQYLHKFEGTLRMTGGAFRNCRPIGLESKGSGADRWLMNKDRTELKFLINTSTSFDGFDFDCGRGTTEIEFDLMVAGKKEPRRIFSGREGANPRSTTFKLPADPDKALAK